MKSSLLRILTLALALLTFLTACTPTSPDETTDPADTEANIR